MAVAYHAVLGSFFRAGAALRGRRARTMAAVSPAEGTTPTAWMSVVPDTATSEEEVGDELVLPVRVASEPSGETLPAARPKDRRWAALPAASRLRSALWRDSHPEREGPLGARNMEQLRQRLERATLDEFLAQAALSIAREARVSGVP